MDLNSLRDGLQVKGFSMGVNREEANSCRWYAYRKIVPTEIACESGQDLVIVVTPYQTPSLSVTNVEVELRGLSGFSWQLMAYNLSPADVAAKIDDIEGRLLSAWRAIARPAPTEQSLAAQGPTQ